MFQHRSQAFEQQADRELRMIFEGQNLIHQTLKEITRRFDELTGRQELVLSRVTQMSGGAMPPAAAATGKVGPTYHRNDTDEDGQWSQGLISAAKMVAAATYSMCEAANAMVQGQANEEKLIASAKEVAGSTAALLVACRVKADPGSLAMQRLQSAGNAVKRATEALVTSAQQQASVMEEPGNITVNQRMVGGITQVLIAQEEIIRKEKELESARRKLNTIYQKQNRFKGDDQDDSSSSF